MGLSFSLKTAPMLLMLQMETQKNKNKIEISIKITMEWLHQKMDGSNVNNRATISLTYIM